jgi:CHAT domain-containing protein
VLSSLRANLSLLEFEPPILVGVGNPLPSARPLTFARAEIDEIATHFPMNSRFPLYEANATLSALKDVLAGATHVHFACHGMFDVANPMESRLFLANDESLTLQEISDRKLFRARLVVLSACQTGLTSIGRLSDEVIGMPAGFVRSGVPGIIAALWPVNDLSTALLMMKFYNYHLPGDVAKGQAPMAPAEALAAAQRWMRTVTNAELSTFFEVKRDSASDRPRMPYQVARQQFRQFTLSKPKDCPFSHPFYWAPFVVTGL